MVYVHTITNLLLSLYTFYKVNILLLYCIILSISKSYISFSVSHDLVTWDCDICDNHTLYLSSK